MATSGALTTTHSNVRYRIVVTENWQDKINAISNVTVKVNFYRTNSGYSTYGTGTVYCVIDGTKYSAAVTPSQKITDSTGIDLFTKTLNISHASNGNKTLTVSAWIEHNVFSSSEQSFSVDLTPIPRASSLSISGTLYLGTELTVKIDRKDNSFTHNLSVVCGSYTKTIATGTASTSVKFTPPLEWANGAPNGTQVYAVFRIGTYSGGTKIGSTVEVPYWINIPASVVPEIKSVTIQEASEVVPSGFPYVYGYSKLKVDIEVATSYGSPIKEIKTTIDGKKYSGASFTTNVISRNGNHVPTVEIKDGRGRIAIYVAGAEAGTWYDYAPPNVDGTLIRCNEEGEEDEQGEYAKVNYRIVRHRLGGANGVSMRLDYKKSSEEEYTSVDLGFVDGNTDQDVEELSGVRIIPADSGSSYDIVIAGADSIALARKNLVLSTAWTIFNIKANGKGIKFGGVAEHDGVDIGQDLYYNRERVDDLVLEQGTTSDGWRYRKWASGFAECWATFTDGGINTSVNQMNGVYYSAGTRKELPFEFEAVEYFSATGGSMGYMNIVRPAGYSATSVSYWVMAWVNTQTNVSVVANLEVKGRWR